MALTPDQIHELKNQLLAQIQNLPSEQREQAKQQIESMAPQALETMLQQQQSSSDKNIFRLIVDKEVDSVIVAETPNSIAVLDINPISDGHTIIIPKNPAKTSSEIPKDSISLGKDLVEKIKSNLNTKSVDIQMENKFGETIIHLIPIYDHPLYLQSQRHKSTIENLQSIAKKINMIVEKIEKSEPLKIKQQPQKIEFIKRNRRIP